MDEIIDSFGRELEFFNDYRRREQAFLKQVQLNKSESRAEESESSVVPKIPLSSKAPVNKSLTNDESLSVRQFMKKQ